MRYPELAKELVRRIKKHMIETGMSVEEIAFGAGIERRTMYDLLNERGNAHDYTLVKLCTYIKIPVEELAPFVDDKYDTLKPRATKAKVTQPPRRAKKKLIKVVRRRRI